MAKITIKAPKLFFDPKALEAEMQRLMVDIGHVFEADFAASMQNFSHKPPISTEHSENDGLYRVVTSVDDENYARLSNGTKDHAVGQEGKVMVFQGFDLGGTIRGQKGYGWKGADRPATYRPKTTPGQLKSNPGGWGAMGTSTIVRKGPWVVAGIKPRKYDELIITKETSKVLDMASKAFANALGKA